MIHVSISRLDAATNVSLQGGYFEPLNGLASRDVLSRAGATRMSIFERKQYRTGFYAEGFGIAGGTPA